MGHLALVLSYNLTVLQLWVDQVRALHPVPSGTLGDSQPPLPMDGLMVSSAHVGRGWGRDRLELGEGYRKGPIALSRQWEMGAGMGLCVDVLQKMVTSEMAWGVNLGPHPIPLSPPTQRWPMKDGVGGPKDAQLLEFP